MRCLVKTILYLFTILITIAGASAALTDNMLAYYSLDNSTGIIDSFGTKNGINAGATFTPNGKIYGAYSFNGTNYINVTNGTIFTGQSVSLWFKKAIATGYPASGDAAIFGAEGTDFYSRIEFFTTYPDRISIRTHGAAGANFKSWVANTTWINDTNWHHLAMSNWGAPNLYIDGQPITVSQFESSGSSSVGRSNYSIGTSGGNLSWAFNGSVDEVAMWTRVITQTEAIQIYNAGVGYDFLLSNYTTVNGTIFDEITNTIIPQNVTETLISSTQTFSFTGGNPYFLAFFTANDSYILGFNTTSYQDRFYTFTITGNTSLSLDAYLLNATLAFPVIFYFKTPGQTPIQNVRLDLQKQFGSNWVTVSSTYTDVSGSTIIYINNNDFYRIVIVKSGYIVPSPYIWQANYLLSPITIILGTTSQTQFISYSNGAVAYITPPGGQINLSDNQTFSLTATSTNNSLSWFAASTNGTTINITGSPSGGTATTWANTSAIGGGNTLIVTYSFQVSGYDPVSFSFNYYLYTYSNITSQNQSAQDIANNLRNNASSAWVATIGIIIIGLITVIVYSITGNSTVSSYAALALTLGLCLTNWFVNPQDILQNISTSIIVIGIVMILVNGGRV